MLVRIIDKCIDHISEDQINNVSQIDVYYGDQNDFSDDVSIFYHYLSDREISRSKRFLKKSDERTYVISHALANKKIAELLRSDFHNLKINYFEDKKPYVEKRNIDFNLSHSADCFAFAISSQENIFVGVDIEVLRENLDIEPIVSNYFHENEMSYVFNRDSNKLAQHQRFYEIWTRKEAFLKMLGIGLTENLSEIDMSPGEREIMIQETGAIDSNIFSTAFIYTFKLPGNQILSVSVNYPLNVVPERCQSL